ncbi:MAG: DUF58 domain-containing protein [Spirochaetes bacterium]|nr:MAG: DUF58 domain-containing protein [Spirochaetota bacterium]
MTDIKSIFKKIKKIEIKTKKTVEEIISGEYHSAFKGRGIEFSDVRDYHYGDDIRLIDWNVTARLNKPYIKTFQEERELSILLAIDVSSSTAFGSIYKTIRELMTEVAALFCFAAIRNNDKVGLVIFNNQIVQYTPPKSGNVNLLKIIKNIIQAETIQGKTSLKSTIEFLNHLKIKKSIVILMSDFLDKDFSKPLKMLSKKHDLIPILFEDPFLKYILEKPSSTAVRDIESEKMILLPEFSEQKKLENNLTGFLNNRYRIFSNIGLDYIRLTTEESYVKPILKFFRKRNRQL